MPRKLSFSILSLLYACPITIVFLELCVTGTRHVTTDGFVPFPRGYPVLHGGHSNHISSPSTVAMRIEPVGVGTFQALFGACTRRCKWTPALRTSKKKHMSKLFGYDLQRALLRAGGRPRLHKAFR
jgi:hypothetical protein